MQIASILRLDPINLKRQRTIVRLIMAGLAWLVFSGIGMLRAGPAAPRTPPEDLYPPAERLTSPSARLHLKNFSFHFHNLNLEKVSGAIEIGSTDSEKFIRCLDLEVSEIRLAGSDPRAPALPGPFKLSGSLFYNRATGALRTQGLTLVAAKLGKLSLTASRKQEGDPVDILASGSSLQPKALTELSKTYRVPLAIGGEVDLKGRVRLDVGDAVDWSATFTTRNGGFHDASFLVGGENLQASLRLAGTWRSGSDRSDISASFRMDHGELLLGRLYFDLTRTPLALSLTGRLDQSGRVLTVKQFDGDLKSIVRGTAKGTIHFAPSGPELDLQLRIPSQNFAKLLDTFVTQPFSDQLPMLKSVHMNGRWSVDLKCRGNVQGPLLQGMLHLSDVSLSESGGAVEVDGLSSALPIWLDPKVTPGIPSPSSVSGSLSVNRISTRFGDIRNLMVLLEVTANRLRIIRPIGFPSADQPLTVESLRIDFPALKSVTGQAVLRTRGFALGPFLGTLSGNHIGATLTAPKWTLTLEGNRLKSAGDLVVRVFSGRLTAKNLEVIDIFSLNRTLFLDADWSDVDLEQLTNVTHFGRITGRLEGSVKGLAISIWGPLAFDMTLRSQDAKGVRQRISVTAIDNLTQVGSGQSPFAGSAIVFKLFKDFSYKKIGIRCILKDQYFSIRGLMEKKGVEYLVQRRGLVGVDIINGNPNNRISWQDMIQRLKRITQSGKQTIQ